MENVIINFTGDATELQPVEDVLEDIIKKGDKVGAAWKKTAADMAAGNKQNADTTNKLAKSIDQLAVAAKSMDKAVIGGAYKDYLKQIQAQLGLTNKEVVSYIQNARKAAREAIFSAETEQEAKELTLSIEAMNDQLKEFGVAEDAAGEKTKSLRARIREAKEELVAMAEAGLQGTPAFQDLQQHAGELDDQMRDLNATVKGLGSDTKNIDGLISIASGVAGGFVTAQGAAALFGDENEEVQKALLKVNAAMSILQGLQSVQNILQKESAAMLLLQSGRTKALAIGQQFLSATTLKTTASTYALRTALIASGIGAIIALLVVASKVMESFGEETESAADAQTRLSDATAALNKSMDDQLALLSNINELNRLRAKAAGKSEQEITALERKEIEERIRLRTVAIDRAIKGGLSVTELTKQQDADIHKLQVGQLEDQIAARERNIEAAKKAVEKGKENADKQREIDERNAKALSEIRQRQFQEEADFLKALSDNPEENLDKRLVSLKAYYDKLQSLNKEQEAQEKSKAGLTANEIKNIELKYYSERVKLQVDFTVAKATIIKEAHEKEVEDIAKFGADQAAAEIRVADNTLKAIEEVYSKLDANNGRNLDQGLTELQNSYNAGLLSLTTYEERRKGIIASTEANNLSNHKAYLEAKIAAEKNAGRSTVELEKQLLAAKDQIRQKDIENDAAAEKKKTEQTQKELENRKAIIAAVYQVTQEAINAIFEIGQQKRQAALDNELAALADQRAKEIENKNLSEQQKDDIDKKFKEKERKLKTEAFIADKKAKKEQAVINGLLAVTNALATAPTIIAGIILAAVVAASTAIQIAKINSTPVPKFKHGKVNIEGPGTTTSDSIPAFISKGESVIKADSTAKWKEALIAINNDHFEGYLAKNIGKFIYPHTPEGLKPAGNQIDYEKLGRSVAEQMAGIMPAPAQVHNHLDGDSIRSFVMTAGSKTEIKNKYFSMS